MKPLYILNPGHGGRDSGAVGPNGLRESWVVLEVCKRVAEIAQGDGFPFEVKLTRSTDKMFHSLQEICDICNKLKATAVVSVHCNSAERAVQGIETFCARKSPRGYELAESLHEAIIHRFPSHNDRGVKRAGFKVLRSTRMPATLLELEFIHTSWGEKHLKVEAVLDHYAEAIVDGLLDYGGFLPLPKHQEPEESKTHKACKLSDQIAHHAKEILSLAKGQ